ncbi:MAG TPA: NAD+ synthase [Candidatus Polarisedimenticolia bacterium]|nr:NAD+ synthase [Candidatus Polarisedimenticolia bacterium]
MPSPTSAIDQSIPAELAIDCPTATRVLSRFIRTEVRRTGFRRVVIGLSGGVDSATSAALACRALGARNVLCVLLPYRTSSPDSLRDARRLARQLGAPTRRIDISPMIDAYFRLQPRASRVRRGNKMARERMSILYDLSVREQALVLGTSNKTELLLGYGTIHGDMASALNPLGDLFKTQVRLLAEQLGIPRAIVWKTATADLWKGQSDEQELGYAYRDIDRLLALLVGRRASATAAVAAGFPRLMVVRVTGMITSSQFKRRPPLIAKLGPRTVNIDFRYPRDWGR